MKRKITAMVLCLTMILSSGITVMAEEQDNGTDIAASEDQGVSEETGLETSEEQAEDTDLLTTTSQNDTEAEDDANSWRYVNGTPVQSLISTYSSAMTTWPTVNVAEAYGVDVSQWQGKIDWEAVQDDGVEYAIIRCGYGQDYTSQDDNYWYTNADACTELGIPFGTYLYSYADTTAKAKSEAEHVLRLVEGYDLSYPIYYDLEDATLSNLSNAELAAIAETFCSTIEEAGYEAGVYANLSWFNTKLTDSVFDQYDKWIAQWNSSCDYTGEYTMWQCTSSGQVDGIDGSVDLDIDLGASVSGSSAVTEPDISESGETTTDTADDGTDDAATAPDTEGEDDAASEDVEDNDGEDVTESGEDGKVSDTGSTGTDTDTSTDSDTDIDSGINTDTDTDIDTDTSTDDGQSDTGHQDSSDTTSPEEDETDTEGQVSSGDDADVTIDNEETDTVDGTEGTGDVTVEFSLPNNVAVSISDEELDVVKESVMAYLGDADIDSVKISLAVEFAPDLSDDVKAAFLDAAGDMKIGQYYGISLNADVAYTDGTIDSVTIPDLTETITVSMEVPSDLVQDGNAYAMLHYEEDAGMAEELDSAYADGMISFETDSFSPFALTYTMTYSDTDEETEDISGDSTTETTADTEDTTSDYTAPQTGDENTVMPWVLVGMMAGCVAVISLVLRKRNEG